MCVYAIWEEGIRSIVYGVTYNTFARLLTKDAPYITIEEIYKQLKTPAEIIGGVLEEEGARIYRH